MATKVWIWLRTCVEKFHFLWVHGNYCSRLTVVIASTPLFSRMFVIVRVPAIVLLLLLLWAYGWFSLIRSSTFSQCVRNQNGKWRYICSAHHLSDKINWYEFSRVIYAKWINYLSCFHCSFVIGIIASSGRHIGDNNNDVLQYMYSMCETNGTLAQNEWAIILLLSTGADKVDIKFRIPRPRPRPDIYIYRRWRETYVGTLDSMQI